MALRGVPEVVSTTRLTGRDEINKLAAGVNTSELEVGAKEEGRTHAEVMEEARKARARHVGERVAAYPGDDLARRGAVILPRSISTLGQWT